ncbi:hypothetical protein BA953_23195 [Vibrio coralliilyticus]|uniref:ATP-binding protein n=1 Tax=Vibrio coralliilyticus TaxID=190893 RepID=UPI000810B978|nr:ATP-binding protein [Vibrio coralliilyticus]ANW27032.1 hypothetical protein BA953_23195 [Vibrio coralliilyticus]
MSISIKLITTTLVITIISLLLSANLKAESSDNTKIIGVHSKRGLSPLSPLRILNVQVSEQLKKKIEANYSYTINVKVYTSINAMYTDFRNGKIDIISGSNENSLYLEQTDYRDIGLISETYTTLIKNIKLLDDRTIGCIKDTGYCALALARYPKSEVVIYERYIDAFNDLESNKLPLLLDNYANILMGFRALNRNDLAIYIDREKAVLERQLLISNKLDGEFDTIVSDIFRKEIKSELAETLDNNPELSLNSLIAKNFKVLSKPNVINIRSNIYPFHYLDKKNHTVEGDFSTLTGNISRYLSIPTFSTNSSNESTLLCNEDHSNIFIFDEHFISLENLNANSKAIGVEKKHNWLVAGGIISGLRGAETSVYGQLEEMIDSLNRGEISKALISVRDDLAIDSLIESGNIKFEDVHIGCTINFEDYLLYELLTRSLNYFNTVPFLERKQVSHEHVLAGREPSKLLPYTLIFVIFITILVFYYYRTLADKSYKINLNKLKLSQKQRRLFSLLLDSLPAGVIIFDEYKKSVFINKTYSNTLKQCGNNTYCSNKDCQFYKLNNRFMLDGQVFDIEINNPECKLHNRSFRLMYKDIADEQSNDKFSLILLVDLTELYLTKRELKVTNDNLEELNRRKEYLLSVLSHEIRTPLSSMLGLIELSISQSAENKELRLDLTNARYAGEHLNSIVNDILLHSKIESNSFSSEEEQAYLLRELGQMFRVFENTAKRKGLWFKTIWTDFNTSSYLIDLTKLKLVVNNILSNSAKFTEIGGISMHVSFDSEHLRILVRDTGIGIDEKSIKNIFSPYVQVDSSLSRAHNGTGLGLSITKNLIEGIGGSIELKSKRFWGTEAYITVPIFELSNSHIDPSRFNYRATNIARCNRWLSKFDHEDCSGEILNIENSEIISHYPDLLYDSILSEDLDYDSDKVSTFKQSISLLLVEDDTIHRYLVGKQLDEIEVQKEIVPNALQALKMLKDKSFDVVLTDCHMPFMSGFELTKKIKSEIDKDIIVIGYSAESTLKMQKMSRESGMFALLKKPYSLNDLQSIIERALSENAQLPKIESVSQETPYWLEKYKGEEAKELGSVVLSSFENDIELLSKVRKTEHLKSLTHRIKGVSTLLGLDSLYQAILACEDIESNDLQDYNDSIDKIISEMKVVLVEAEEFLNL